MDSRAHPPTRGHTLLELATTLSLVAAVAGLALPPIAGVADRWAVVSARDATAVLAHRARTEARLHGGAALVIGRRGAEVRVGDSVAVTFEPMPGVEVDLGGADSLVLRWDALGVGRVASRTLRLRRDRAEAVLVFSSTGRVRRR